MEETIFCPFCGERCTALTIRSHSYECLPLRREVKTQAVRKFLTGREWIGRAACAGKDVEEFFLDDAARLTMGSLQAKACCFPCPVRRSCLSWALEKRWCPSCETHHPEEFGIFGGATGRERERLGHNFTRVNDLVKRQMKELKRKDEKEATA